MYYDEKGVVQRKASQDQRSTILCGFTPTVLILVSIGNSNLSGLDRAGLLNKLLIQFSKSNRMEDGLKKKSSLPQPLTGLRSVMLQILETNLGVPVELTAADVCILTSKIRNYLDDYPHPNLLRMFLIKNMSCP